MSFTLTLAGEVLQLLPERAVYWRRTRTLLVADVHLGKGAALRRAGVALPQGGTQEDLARLAAAVAVTGAERLLVLGDFFHTDLRHDTTTGSALAAFRQAHRALSLAVVRGNHDRGVEQQPAEWQIDWQTDGLHEAPFILRHAPEPDARGCVLAGHVHPVVRLKTGVDGLRLPVFWHSPAQNLAVLPAFGVLTGGHPIRPQALDTVIGFTPEGVLPLSSTWFQARGPRRRAPLPRSLAAPNKPLGAPE